jgi:hypothetical protein
MELSHGRSKARPLWYTDLGRKAKKEKERPMTGSYLKATALVLCTGLAGLLIAATASSIPVTMTTSNGTVAGTGITYTISVVGDDGGPRNIFPSTSSDNGVWTWTGGFPEFLSFGQAEIMTVTFSAPVPIADFVFGVESTSASTGKLTVSGGTAGVGDFNLTDSLQVYTGPNGAAVYNPANGQVTASGQNQSVMIGSTSTNTVTSFTFAAGASDDGGDGYTVFFGTLNSPPSGTPAPPSVWLAVAGCVALLGYGLWFRRRAVACTPQR